MVPYDIRDICEISTHQKMEAEKVEGQENNEAKNLLVKEGHWATDQQLEKENVIGFVLMKFKKPLLVNAINILSSDANCDLIPKEVSIYFTIYKPGEETKEEEKTEFDFDTAIKQMQCKMFNVSIDKLEPNKEKALLFPDQNQFVTELLMAVNSTHTQE